MTLRASTRGFLLTALLLLGLGALGAAPALAAEPNHPFLPKRFNLAPTITGENTPAGNFEDACGIAVDGHGDIYVADYHHHAVDVFDPEGKYLTQIAGVDQLDGPCGLAVDSAGTLYVNYYHRKVARYVPSAYPFSQFDLPKYSAPTVIDSNHPTGVAVDPATDDLYVDDRTYVAVYEPSGEPVLSAADPLRIGRGTIGDGYGLAVSSFPATDGYVYVADAGDDTVKVFDPATDSIEPVAAIDGAGTPQGGFASLFDSSLALDQSNGHLFVADNTQPGFEHPAAAIDEFGAAGLYRDQLAHAFVHGEPVGIAVDESTANRGDVYVTSGNGSSNVFPSVPNAEESVLYAFGPAGPDEPAALVVSGGQPLSSGQQGCVACASGQGVARTRTGGPPGASASEVSQHGNLRVSVDGKLSPHALPRDRPVAVRVSVGARIASTDGETPPQLQAISIAINRYGRLDSKGLPVCRLEQIQPATTADALAVCRRSLVGEGHFSAKVLLKGQAPFPSEGKVFAFNGEIDGRPAILAHVYGTRPAPASYTLPFLVSRAKGTFATVLRASLPGVTADSGYVTGLELTLGRSFSYRGHRRSYLSASCPAPEGFPGAVFPFARANFGFAGGKRVASTLTRSCSVR